MVLGRSHDNSIHFHSCTASPCRAFQAHYLTNHSQPQGSFIRPTPARLSPPTLRGEPQSAQAKSGMAGPPRSHSTRHNPTKKRPLADQWRLTFNPDGRHLGEGGGSPNPTVLRTCFISQERWVRGPSKTRLSAIRTSEPTLGKSVPPSERVFQRSVNAADSNWARSRHLTLAVRCG